MDRGRADRDVQLLTASHVVLGTHVRMERLRPTVVRLTADVRDLAALVSAARWVLEGCPGRLPAEAVEQLRQALADYDEAGITPRQ